MKFNYKGRGFVVITLAIMLVAVGTINYKLSRQSLMETSKEFKAFEQSQSKKNSTTGKAINNKKNEDVKIVDSKKNNTAKDKVKDRVTKTSKEIKKQLNSVKNKKKDSYILDMKMTREKQRNELVQDLNEMINNPSTNDQSRKEASNMKLSLVKDQDTELKIENILSTRGFDDSLIYISDGKVNVVVNKKELNKKDAAKIFDLVSEQANVNYENIKLTNNKR